MIQALRDLQVVNGATFAEGADVPASFGNDSEALQAAQVGVALYDRTDWGRILVRGDDRLRFLHNQTTNSFNQLQAGQGCDTVFVNSTGRTIDLVSAYVLEDAVLLLTSPGYGQRLFAWMDRFIFFADKVELKDITTTTAAFSLIGPQSQALLEQLGMAMPDQADGGHQLVSVDGIEIRVAVGSGLASSGYTLILPGDRTAVLWAKLSAAGAVALGQRVWERLRIEQGRPMPDRELTEEFNPLETGLWQSISLSKGCYIGQETIARLHTYRGVKQQLWGIHMTAAAEPGTLVMVDSEKIGKLTSCAPSDRGYLGLAYIRTKAAAAGLKVQVGDREAKLVAVPFVTHEYP
jgi:tRNA-modifying protein YgfZ